MGSVSEIGVNEGADAWAPRIAAWPEPTKRVIVVASARNEGIYLLEWVAHYLLLGADSILIYTNDNSDGSDELLRALARNVAEVSVIFNRTDPSVSAQRKGYQHALAESPLVAEHEWACFVDIDEFVCPRADGDGLATLPCFIGMVHEVHGASVACLNWSMQHDDPTLEYRSGLVTAQYPMASVVSGAKSIFRLRDSTRFRSVHRVELLPGKRGINGSGHEMDPARDRIPCVELGCIRHYWHRSFAEFDARIARGVGTQPRVGGVQRVHADYFSGRPSTAVHDPCDPRWVAMLGDSVAKLLSNREIADAHSCVRESTEARLRLRASALGDIYRSLSEAAVHARESMPRPPVASPHRSGPLGGDPTLVS